MLGSILGAQAATLWLDWTPNPANQQVTKYNIYEKINSVYVLIGTTTTNEYQLTNVVPARHTWVMTAVNFWGETPYSNEVGTPELGTAPATLRIRNTTNQLTQISFDAKKDVVYDLQETEKFDRWTSVATFYLNDDSEATYSTVRRMGLKFYRTEQF